MNPYHKFIIKNRIYCQHEGCRMKLERATKVVKRHGKEIVVCDFHGYTPRPIEEGLKRRWKLEMQQ